jgi:hypothetical protein
MQPAQRLPGPGTAARSSEDVERAAPRPLTEVSARPPGTRPQLPAGRLTAGSDQEGGAATGKVGLEGFFLLSFSFFSSLVEPSEEMLTASFSSPAMFRATATRELCSWLTFVPGGAPGNFDEPSAPPLAGLYEGARKRAGGATLARGFDSRRDLF